MINDFNKDLKFSFQDSEIFNNFYHKIFGTRLHTIYTVTDLKTQKLGIDKKIILKSGKEITIDEKIRRKDYGDIAIEIFSDTFQKTQGWILKSYTDYICYLIKPTNYCYLIPVLLTRLVIERYADQIIPACVEAAKTLKPTLSFKPTTTFDFIDNKRNRTKVKKKFL